MSRMLMGIIMKQCGTVVIGNVVLDKEGIRFWREVANLQSINNAFCVVAVLFCILITSVPISRPFSWSIREPTNSTPHHFSFTWCWTCGGRVFVAAVFPSDNRKTILYRLQSYNDAKNDVALTIRYLSSSCYTAIANNTIDILKVSYLTRAKTETFFIFNSTCI